MTFIAWTLWGVVFFAIGFAVCAVLTFEIYREWKTEALEWQRLAKDFQSLAIKAASELAKLQVTIDATCETPRPPFETI